MLRNLWCFTTAVARHWGRLMTSGFFIAIATLWQGSGHKFLPFVWWLIAAIALFSAFFKAWEAEHDAKEDALRRLAPTPSTVSPSTMTWQELYDKKKQLEKELDAQLDAIELLEPQRLRNGMQPDDPYAWYTVEPDATEYGKRSRRIDRIKEELEIIKEKLRGAS